MIRITDPREAALAFQRGEEAGFDFFFNTIYSSLRYYAYRIVQDVDIAEEFACEAFCKTWERHSWLNHEKVIKSYLYTTVRNCCLNYLLKEKRREKRHGEYAKQVCLIEDCCDENMIRAEVINQLHQTLEVLPFACKKIFELIYIHGLTVRECAKRLNLHISTVKNQKIRGLTIIRKKCPWIEKVNFI